MNGFGGNNNKKYDLGGGANDLRYGNNYDRANAETRALLDVEQSRFEVGLQRLY